MTNLLSPLHPSKSWVRVIYAARKKTADPEFSPAFAAMTNLFAPIQEQIASRHNEVTSAMRAACSGSSASETLGCVGLTSNRSMTFKPAPLIMASNSSRVRKPRCSAKSESISQPSPPGAKWAAKPPRNPRNMLLSWSYIVRSIVQLGLTGNHGGLHTINGARPSGNRSACTSSICPRNPSRSMFKDT